MVSGENGTPDKERRSDESAPKMRSKKIDASQEQELLQKAGFTDKDLYNRRGWLDKKGLASIMETGDRIVEVCDDHVILETPSGVRQTFWNFRKDLSFLRHIGKKKEG